MTNRAWVTLATNDSYGLGALVLANSIRRTGSTYPAVILVTPAVTDAMRERLNGIFAEVITVDVLDSRDAAHLALLQRPELGVTFTKIHCWSLVQYEKCVFLDADTLVIQNSDDLFEREELSAAPDIGWPDCFNSGVFVFTPSKDTFDALIKFAQERGSFDGGDQGLLNSYFSDWARGDLNKHLPFLYNVTSAAFYSYLPAFKEFGQDVKIIHFIGASKPWLQHYNWESGTVDAPDHLRDVLQLWWSIFVSSVHQQLDTAMTGVAGNLARVVPGAPSNQRDAIDELTRRQGWEAGNIDYMGADSFDNIWAKISQTLNQSPPKQSTPPKEPSPYSVVEATSVVADGVSKDQSIQTQSNPTVETSPAPKQEPALEVKSQEQVAPVEAVPLAPKQEPALEVKSQEQVAPVEAVPLAPKQEPALEVKSQEQVAPVEAVPLAPKEEPVIETKAAPPANKEEPVLETKSEEPAKEPETEPPSATVQEQQVKEDKPNSEALTTAQSLEPSTEIKESIPKEDAAIEPTTAGEVDLKSEEKSTPPQAEESIENLEPQPKQPIATPIPVPEPAAKETVADTPQPETPASPSVAVEAPSSPAAPTESKPPQNLEVLATPEKTLDVTQTAVTESPPLANTPSKEDVPLTTENAETLTSSTEKAEGDRRKRVAGKLQLTPPAAVVEALPTPDSELEDAASLAQRIIASELSSPTVTAATPAAEDPITKPSLTSTHSLPIDAPVLETPPAGPVQEPGAKPKPTIAAQIESSLIESVPDTPDIVSPITPATGAAAEPIKKKLVKKVKKTPTVAEGTEAPVPPPRKKEKKPKEK